MSQITVKGIKCPNCGSELTGAMYGTTPGFHCQQCGSDYKHKPSEPQPTPGIEQPITAADIINSLEVLSAGAGERVFKVSQSTLDDIIRASRAIPEAERVRVANELADM